CIRDYIDINDLVDAHILALDAEENGIINLGTSTGVSVKELVDMTMEVTGKKLNYEVGSSREGDPAGFVASNEKAKKVLGWVPKRGIREMIKTTYRAYFG
ncbi:MAG: GDP-mannose 4,6-dehydratase, partial [Nanoarchaeota archaeon]|nr:GDP-mannose 4,6-dehydratase [Nanoarchaeota archaeon]